MAAKIHGMPISQTSLGPALFAEYCKYGKLEMCNITEGATKTEAFVKLNPYAKVPTLEEEGFSMGESAAILRYMALKSGADCYPVTKPQLCARIDFAMDAFGYEVYKVHTPIVYHVMGFQAPTPADAIPAAAEAYAAAASKWLATFVGAGPFVGGEALSIADFKAVPFLYAGVLCGEVVEGFTMPDEVKAYCERFIAAVPCAAMLNEYGGYSLKEYILSKRA